ncbi:MAG: nucleotide exchange factor GrpE [Acidobacteriota bacterium]|nr:nucleotide exchange factor GrpE [Acidobacteriota bacterium]
MNSQTDTTEIILDDIDKLPSLEDLMQELEAVGETAFDDGKTPGGIRVVAEKSVEPLLEIEPAQPAETDDATAATLLRLKRENDELTAALRRVQSDFENYRRRVERERGDNYAFALMAIVNNLLPVLDNFRIALANAENRAADKDLQQFFSGFELISQQLEKVLNTMGLQRISALGETFNPQFHEAVSTEFLPDSPPNTVVEEIVRGYRLGNKLVRPAMVKVSVNAE